MNRRRITSDERTRIIQRLKGALENETEVQLAYLHGSVANEDVQHVGDIDIAVLLDESPNKEHALERELELENRLADQAEIPLDLRVLNFAPVPFCFAAITQGTLLLSRSPEAKDAFETKTLAVYRDLRYHLEEYRRDALGMEA